MYYKLICLLYALLCGQNFILVKSGCYIFYLGVVCVYMSRRVFIGPKVGRVVKVELEAVLQRGRSATTCGCIPCNGLVHVNNFFG
jgi:hypothetical protein